MMNPGVPSWRSYQHQIVFMTPNFKAMPVDCSEKFERVSHTLLRLQNPKRPKSWIRLTYPRWDGTYWSNKAGDGYFSDNPNGHFANEYYKCSPGKRKTRVQIILRNQVRGPNGKVFGQRFFKIPVAVEGGGC